MNFTSLTLLQKLQYVQISKLVVSQKMIEDFLQSGESTYENTVDFGIGLDH